jgi:hypothetical protein
MAQAGKNVFETDWSISFSSYHGRPEMPIPAGVDLSFFENV